MSTLIRNGRIEIDEDRPLPDDVPLIGEGRWIVPLGRYLAERDTLIASGVAFGVTLPNTVDIDTLWPDLAGRPLLVLQFPTYTDGRAYSQARVLAERYRYGGELRASGTAVVRDQIHFMARCGFTSFALREDQDAAACLAAWNDFSAVYQPAADPVIPILVQRRG